MSTIADNLRRVEDRIAEAVERSGRSCDDVTLVAVSKTQPVETIEEALRAGLVVLGENRVQEAEGKVDALGQLARWHLVGHLQRNKVKKALEMFELIQSVDSLRLAREIGKRATSVGSQARVLVQVNTSSAESQFGLPLEEAAEFVSLVAEVEGVQVEGLMTIGAFLPDPEAVRPCFVRLRELRDRISDKRIQGVSMDTLSMGMTGDFEVAIEEGATLVRIGTAIFGARSG
ncbi:MAG: YggS family pyridoxal phosphate-dependent enzyme [Candidatus Latescibacteria bacterium]|jgi:hypothetical protein|nr:YggS family pyridoxal phosphate-dependent enzyme [Candidatus Latescibacterota bacterium]